MTFVILKARILIHKSRSEDAFQILSTVSLDGVELVLSTLIVPEIAEERKSQIKSKLKRSTLYGAWVLGLIEGGRGMNMRLLSEPWGSS